MDPMMEILMHQNTHELSHSSQWAEWIAMVEFQARILNIWEYVNPDLPEEPQIPVVPPLVAPITGEGAQTVLEYANQLEYRGQIEPEVDGILNGLASFNIYFDQLHCT